MDELNLKALVRVFRRECHRVLESERTTVHGADSMLMVLQLAAAEVHKQVTVAWWSCVTNSGHRSTDAFITALTLASQH